MYRAEEFLRGVPMFQDGFIQRLEREGCLPFDPGKLKKCKCSSSERALLDFSLMLFNCVDNKFHFGRLMSNLSHEETLRYVGEWVAKGFRALD